MTHSILSVSKNVGPVARLAFVLVAFHSSMRTEAQLPPESVILSKVKISEKQKSDQLCPVHLVASDSELPTFEYDGVKYRGHTLECQSEFEKMPALYVNSAELARWEHNFILSMSTIWCPVTDQVNPGGFLKWTELGVKWESCCKFCNASVYSECFPDALKRLKLRGKEAFKATKGKYIEGATSPVQGAIEIPE